MGVTDDIGQKVKGKVEKVKGEFNQQRGKGIKGGYQKIKGSINETIADTKLKNRTNRDPRLGSDDF